MKIRSLSLKDKVINYKIIYKNKKNISIRLNGNNEILVYSPYGISDDYIEDLIRKKENWIIKNLINLNDSHYNDENCIIYRGKKLIKNMEESNTEYVIIEKDSILIRAKNLDSKYIESLLFNWYIEMANKIILNRTKELSNYYNLIPLKVIIKDQKSRWGSCNSKREVRLNWRLILMPEEVMDYIIIHELSHLKYMNHSSEFWALVEELKPDYKVSQKWLKDNGLALF